MTRKVDEHIFWGHSLTCSRCGLDEVEYDDDPRVCAGSPAAEHAENSKTDEG